MAPDSTLFLSHEDRAEGLQQLWLSTQGTAELPEPRVTLCLAGAQTHTHFDSDHNLFVQLWGRKRWYLVPPAGGQQLCPYPRLHPLWHKAAADFQHPDTERCEGSEERDTWLMVELQPGDVLYVPPFYWHFVRSVTSSVSLTTYSRARGISERLHAIYSHEHQFGELEAVMPAPLMVRMVADKVFASNAAPGPQPQGGGCDHHLHNDHCMAQGSRRMLQGTCCVSTS